MVKWNPLESRWQAILDVAFVTVPRLPAAFHHERRDMAARHTLMHRILSEFEEMPGLSLTVGQAGKIFGVRVEIVGRILERLTDAHALRRRNDGQFALHVAEG
jgi:hypothetical protein